MNKTLLIAIAVAAACGFGIGMLAAKPSKQACAEHFKQDDSLKKWLKAPKSSGW